MTILDRYIVRHFLTNVVVLFLILFCLIVAVDASFNVDRFWRLAGARAPEAGGVARLGVAAWLVLDLWLPRLALLFNFLLGIVMVSAVGFTCGQMARHREFVAVLAGGVSLYRLSRPIFASAVGLVLVQAVNQEMLLPRLAPLLAREHRDAGLHQMGHQGRLLVPDGAGRVFYIRTFDADSGVIEDVSVLERDERRRAVRRIDARRGRWDGGAWVLSGVRRTSLEGGGQVVEGGQVRVETDLGPTSLRVRRYSKYARNLGTADLLGMLRGGRAVEARVREQLELVLYGRYAAMAVHLLALAIALPFYLTRDPPNLVLQSVRCAPVAGVALIGGVLGVMAKIPGVPPGLSVFLPAVILAPVAVAQMTSIRT